MSNRSVESDDFARGLSDILDEVAQAGGLGAVEAVKTGIKVGAREWRKDIKENVGSHTYRRSGKVYETGAYQRSIRTHMLDKSEEHPAGEVGSPKLPWLSHLLEFGHARIGGGRVDPVIHVSDDAEVAFDAAMEAAENAIREALE